MDNVMPKWKAYYSLFFVEIANDPRIRMAHLAVFSALFHLWASGSENEPVRVYANEVMVVAKISCKITYLRIVAELSSYGYLEYRPSNTRYVPSEIRLLEKKKAN